MTGTGLVSLPCFCHSLIRRMQVNPSMTEKVLVQFIHLHMSDLIYLAFRDP